jgi:hypothetical protein
MAPYAGTKSKAAETPGFYRQVASKFVSGKHYLKGSMPSSLSKKLLRGPGQQKMKSSMATVLSQQPGGKKESGVPRREPERAYIALDDDCVADTAGRGDGVDKSITSTKKASSKTGAGY